MELTNLERAKYAEIIAWCEHMKSLSYYLTGEIYRAIEADAPSGTIYMTDGIPHSVYDMSNIPLQAAILRRASEIRTVIANRIVEDLGPKDLLNTAYNQSVLSVEG